MMKLTGSMVSGRIALNVADKIGISPQQAAQIILGHFTELTKSRNQTSIEGLSMEFYRIRGYAWFWVNA